MTTVTSSFFDLCLQESYFSQEDLEQTLKVLYDFGYRTIAVNQSIEEENIESKKKRTKGKSRDAQIKVPVPYNLKKIQETATKLGLENFKVFNRLTVTFSNQESLHQITNCPNYKKFHIIAVSPMSMQALIFTCSNFEADIFTFSPENKFNIRLNRKFYKQLVERGYYIELLYSHAIEDSTKRKNLIHAAHLFHTFGRSKNIIFSSGAENYIYIRSPYDIINLGFIFGLGELQCKSAISYCPNKVILHSVGRRHGKAVMFVENVEEIAVAVPDDSEEHMEVDQPIFKKKKM